MPPVPETGVEDELDELLEQKAAEASFARPVRKPFLKQTAKQKAAQDRLTYPDLQATAAPAEDS